VARLLIIITCLVSIILYSFYLASPANSKSSQKVEFVIQQGQNLDQITNNLKKQNLVRSVPATKLLILAKGISKDIQAGYFYLSPSSDLGEIVSSLTEAGSKQVWITIPEGLRREEIALIIEGSFPNISAQDFVLATKGLEGHLFPETYALNPGSSTETVVKKLTDQFDKVIEDLAIPVTDLNSTLTLASLLEREARNFNEMLEIAGILKKRLKAGWPLQIDATVQFALASQTCSQTDCDYWKKSLTKDDIQTPSPYNTYKYLGLPPDPIANPGLEAIKASFQAISSDYWFYLHDSNGQIRYAKTIEEHNQNICTYLKKDCY